MDERIEQFLRHFPPQTELLKMEPDKLGPFVLRFLKKEGHHSGMLNRHNFGVAVPNGPIGLRLMEAWVWLERDGFLAPKPGDPDNVFL